MDFDYFIVNRIFLYVYVERDLFFVFNKVMIVFMSIFLLDLCC